MTSNIATEQQQIELKKSIIEQMIGNGDFDLNRWGSVRHETPQVFFEKLFTDGLCVNFAEAAQQYLCDWNKYVIFFGESESNYREHTVLKHPTKDLFFDVLGFRDMPDILASYDATDDHYIWHDLHDDPTSMYELNDYVMSQVTVNFVNHYKQGLSIADSKIRPMVPHRGFDD